MGEPLPKDDTAQREQGAILLIVLVLIFAVTLAVMAYLYLNKNNTLIASNLAVQNAAQEATDAGLHKVQNLLATVPNPPPSSISPWYVAPTSSGTPPTAPLASFWQSCASANTCGKTTVAYGPYHFIVNYVVYPLGPNAQNNGYYYVTYIHSSNANGGGLGVTIEATLENTQ
ncbi:hypothetical protein HFU84_02785 [Acidithiobacillus sp. CV18-2]|uniref:Type 4 fimbrial biogenesis protein PilX N-terminal domain-containing protein n=1 Tax=Igneacidithiobacillus copahuensis TaxID=2724909 RepID=A0AAE2YNM5_9PROT|nr:hypothetical protein [Acidithiobacillus sp. CV18-3]MBU2756508.1 hypothetical protein [Acidithiobacillus sp. BN09-2]MBU2776443.1 hypothetical protein [Acidithiobacillus sp. CV18-2]MBU2787200.1 hypothetical protein [Igneacidithiobacillus copahuensis]MBU2797519.1 hypothetical protein [Acidithiobacillus sp. VAN18-2]MBU2799153.1 hypothetical protein [Acidithiobacillus sp. VAN18-4]